MLLVSIQIKKMNVTSFYMIFHFQRVFVTVIYLLCCCSLYTKCVFFLYIRVTPLIKIANALNVFCWKIGGINKKKLWYIFAIVAYNYKDLLLIFILMKYEHTYSPNSCIINKNKITNSKQKQISNKQYQTKKT